MKFSYTLAAVFATAAVAAPVAQIPEVPVDAGLLAKLSPDVAALVTGLGLTSLAPGLASTLITLSEGLKVRDLPTEVPVDAGLLAKLSPDVAALVTGLGLTSLAPGLASTLITLSAGLKTRQIEPVVHTVESITAPLTETVSGLVKPLGVRQIEPVVHTVESITAPLTETVSGLVKPLGVRDVAGIPVDAGLLAKLSPDVAALVTGLGLTTLAPGLASTLITLSEGLKTRQVPDLAAELKPALEAILGQVTGAVEDKVVPAVQGTVEKVVPQVTGAVEKVTGALGGVGARDIAGVPVDAGLLAKLSPDVAALVTGLGLTTLAPGLASTLITLSEGLKTRAESVVPDIPVDAGLLAKLSPDVAALVSGLGLTSIAPGLAATLVTLSEGLKTRQIEPVVHTVESITAPLTETVSGLVKPLGVRQIEPVVDTVEGVVAPVVEKVSGLASGVVGRDVAGVPVDAGLLAKLSPDVAALVTGLGLTSLAPGLASTLITLSEGLKTRQSTDPLAKVTQALEAILGQVTDVVSDVAGPVLGGVGAREVPVVSEVEGLVAKLTGGGAVETVSTAAGAIPVDAGLLAQLSAPIAALVSGLGLVSIAPGLAATLITLSQGL